MDDWHPSLADPWLENFGPPAIWRSLPCRCTCINSELATEPLNKTGRPFGGNRTDASAFRRRSPAPFGEFAGHPPPCLLTQTGCRLVEKSHQNRSGHEPLPCPAPRAAFSVNRFIPRITTSDAKGEFKCITHAHLKSKFAFVQRYFPGGRGWLGSTHTQSFTEVLVQLGRGWPSKLASLELESERRYRSRKLGRKNQSTPNLGADSGIRNRTRAAGSGAVPPQKRESPLKKDSELS